MAERNWPQHAVQIGVFEFRRTLRAIREDKARAVLLAAGLVFPSFLLSVFVYLFADLIRDQGLVQLPAVARGMVALLWLFGVFIATQRVVSARPRIDAESLMLTTVSPRTAAGGLVVAETLRGLAYLGLPTLVLTASAVYLFVSPVSVVAIPLAAVLFTVTAVLAGMGLGYAIALLIATSPFVARHKTVLGGIAVLVAMGAYLLLTLPQFAGFDQSSLAWLPVGWYADLAAVGTPIRGSVSRTAGILAGSLVLIGLGGSLVEREATALWFIDPVSGEKSSTNDTRGTIDVADDGVRESLRDAIRPVVVPTSVSQPTRRVAQWSILRTRRDPRRLNFLLMPVVMVGSGLFSTALQAESFWSLLAPACAVLLPWMAGATFAMNPFGDEGAVLPVTLLSVTGRSYVRGSMLPGLLFGFPIAVAVTTLTAAIAPYGVVATLGLGGVCALVTLVAVSTAPAVGLWFPRFSAISVGQSREVIPPRLLTTALHFLGIVIPGSLLALLVVAPQLARALLAGVFGYVPALILQLAARGNSGIMSKSAMWFGEIGTDVQALAIDQLQGSGGVLLVVVGLGIVVGSYRMAIRRFDRYSPPT
ncbi:hypothetical protein [Natrinema caseinilyticum]|uniref:hypothetical protein n=1 Tax=Natrinema caseinilyticum TaxID=2961570 RepID=UPI0020C58BD4|nr:hypothetical protein [Natrinema caseinilyticum]